MKRTTLMLAALLCCLAASGPTKAGFTTLDAPSATATAATGISGNNIVGYYIDATGFGHGFLYNGSSYTTLDDPLATGVTAAYGISGNNIVGVYGDATTGFGHGFLYQPEVSAVPAPSSLTLLGTAALTAFGYRGWRSRRQLAST